MRNIADITDDTGAWVRIDLRPGPDLDNPQLIMVTIKDDALAAVSLTRAQANELIDGLTDALWQAD